MRDESPIEDQEIEGAFRDFVGSLGYPCVGARSALALGSYSLRTYAAFAEGETTSRVADDLRAFSGSSSHPQAFSTFVAVFRAPAHASETEFETLLWDQLAQLRALDSKDWDRAVSPDPQDPRFAFSFNGRAFYVIGLHPSSSRRARAFPFPALVFNFHETFETMRLTGQFDAMRRTIRRRDIAFSGDVNPMLSRFGERSEAREYSGRVVDPSWKCPRNVK